MSNNFVAVLNRLLTAAMIVALLIACQDMPESQNFGIQLESQENQSRN
ncbi:MAG: hypothetical protein QNJ53_22990 [Pleurocapsa sp. MO_192.B19]|nr:hypothetical protein [Pleurocapsa sp. MO_192.B19]